MWGTMTADETSGGGNQVHDEGHEIAGLETQFDIVRYMRRKCEDYGLKYFIAFTLPGFEAEKLSTYSIVSNWPSETLAKYDALRMVRHSASIRKLRLTTVPFSYDMLEWIGESSEADELSELLDIMRRHGMLTGHFFPVHDALGNRGAIVWSGEATSLGLDERLMLQMISVHLFNRLAEIGAAWKTGQVVLTEREIQCLSWTAAGKTSLEIAEILGLSEHTVNHYLNQVTRKLEAVNRTQAVVKAIRRGLIA
jgi:LuxR family quorum sensing-dependent transcriptional regulator